ncbi:MAG: hypothetical protein ACK56F_15320 [bacterium]
MWARAVLPRLSLNLRAGRCGRSGTQLLSQYRSPPLRPWRGAGPPHASAPCCVR